MKRTVFSIHPLIRNTLLIVPLLLVLAVYFLKHGVTIDSLDIGQFKVQGLYLKLDKKLVVKVDYLALPKKKKKADFSQLEASMDRIKWLPKYFQSIYLDKVDFTNNQYRVVYKDNVIYLSSNAYEVAGMLKRKGNIIEGSFPLLHIKKYDIRLSGRFQYEYQKDIIAVDANYTIADISGHLLAKSRGDIASFRIDTDRFKSVKNIIKLLNPGKTAKEWMLQRVHASGYEIVSFDGLVRHKNDSYRLDYAASRLKAKLIKPNVKFNDRLGKIYADSAIVTLENNTLHIGASRPKYGKNSLEGSRFFITDLLGSKPSVIHAQIKVRTRFDRSVSKILKAYDIHIPVLQHRGSINAKVNIAVPTRGDHARIDGDLVLDKGSATVYGSLVNIYSGKIHFDNRTIILKRVDASNSWMRGVLNGIAHIDTRQAALAMDVRYLNMGSSRNPFIKIRNKQKIPIIINWKHQTRIDIAAYKTTIKLQGEHGLDIVCSDIKPILPYLKGVHLPIKSGTVRVSSKDSKHYSFSGKVTWPSSYLYGKRGTITAFPFNGNFYKGSTNLSALGGRIKYSSAKSLIRLNNLYIDARKALLPGKKSSSRSTRMHIIGTNSMIRYEKYVLLADKFDLRIHGRHTKFTATKDGDTVRVDINGDAIVVRANRIKAPMLRALIHFGGLSGGRYSLDLHGRMNGTMKGVITVTGGVASSFKTYNNLIALFNTVPALTTLSDPGFSKKGFEIRTARIEFRVVKNRVFFDTIFVDGKSAAISGKGTVSTINGAIDMDLAVRSARGIGKIIGSIPIVGYILMGKDKSITTGVKVTGTLENPKVTTHVVMETLLAPFEMLVRTIKSPAHIINK